MKKILLALLGLGLALGFTGIGSIDGYAMPRERVSPRANDQDRPR